MATADDAINWFAVGRRLRTTQMTYNGSPGETFTQSWTWNTLGDLGSITDPACQFDPVFR